MNISINNSVSPFTVTFQRRIWMQYIYTIAKTYKSSNNYAEYFELISKLQAELNNTVEEGGEHSITMDLNRTQLGILNSASKGYFIPEPSKYSKVWEDSRELVIITYKQLQ
jgi:hypothetical protein